MIQRSGDMLTASGAGGINEIQYAALQMLVAQATGYQPGVFTHFVANEQIYDRHIDNAHILLDREPTICSPRLTIRPFTDISKVTIDDFILENYVPIKEPKLFFELGI